VVAVTATRRNLTRRTLALGAVIAVLGLAFGGRPSITLYDGVLPAEPYKWLDPPPGQPGDPQGATATLTLQSGKSPLVAVATPELVPQAQVFAIPGGLILPTGTTTIDVSIAAVEPPALPPNDHIAGNVYAITVTNQAGTPITADPAAQVSVVLRAPDPTTATATIARFDGSTWQPVSTQPAGVGATFSAVVTQFGDFAVLLPGPAESALPSVSAEASAAGPTAVATAPEVTPQPGGPFGLDRGTLTIVLAGAALVIVGLIAAAALLPSRRGPPAGRSGWSSGSGSGPKSRRRDRR
jgi:hypothetical protein